MSTETSESKVGNGINLSSDVSLSDSNPVSENITEPISRSNKRTRRNAGKVKVTEETQVSKKSKKINKIITTGDDVVENQDSLPKAPMDNSKHALSKSNAVTEEKSEENEAAEIHKITMDRKMAEYRAKLLRTADSNTKLLGAQFKQLLPKAAGKGDPPLTEPSVIVSQKKLILDTPKNGSQLQPIKILHLGLQRVLKPMLPARSVDQVRERRHYCERLLALEKGERTIIYLNETSFQISMYFTKNDLGSGEMSHSIVPYRNKRMMSSMTEHELLHYKVDTWKVVCPVIEYLKELCVVLKQRSIVGAVIVVDTALCNSLHEIREYIHSEGHLVLVLVANCPFLNPLEHIFAEKIPNFSVMTYPSMVELDKAVNGLLESVTADQCRKYYQLVRDNAQGCLLDDFVFDG